jgi:hypothetical protein
MLLEGLINRFKSERNRNPSHVNELLDFVQRSYIYGELSIKEYKNLYFELDRQNAVKPSFS